MTRQAITTTGAPAALGPYSQGIAIDGLLFCSGQIGLDPTTGELAAGVEAQAERGWADVVKTTIFLADIGDFAAINTVYATHVADPPPARSTFAVGALPRGALIEIEAIARRR